MLILHGAALFLSMTRPSFWSGGPFSVTVRSPPPPAGAGAAPKPGAPEPPKDGPPKDGAPNAPPLDGAGAAPKSEVVPRPNDAIPKAAGDHDIVVVVYANFVARNLDCLA